MFGPEPASRVPGPEDAIELDDKFLSGDPMAYFDSRIHGLLASVRSMELAEGGIAGEYAALLGGRKIEQTSTSDRMLQVALDSFSLRHHAAETLLRFVVAVADAGEAKDGTACLWFHASDGSPQIGELLKRYRPLVTRDDAVRRLVEMLLPMPQNLARPRDAERLDQALEVMFLWLNRALFLLQRDDLHLNGVANKIKHGLTAHVRDDLRVAMFEGTSDPGPLARASVLNGPTAIKLFDSIAVEAIGRPGRGEALEQTVLMLRPARLLTEAHMIARVHASAFHVAAVKHLGNRNAYTPAQYPSLEVGPVPEQVHQDAVVGSRRPVTFRKNGSPSVRKRGYAREREFTGITFTGMARTFSVTDD